MERDSNIILLPTPSPLPSPLKVHWPQRYVKVKKAKNSDNVEILLKTSSEVHCSPKHSKAKKVLTNTTCISLSQLPNQNDYACFTVSGTVVRIEDPVQVSPTLTKQNVTIADDSAAAKLIPSGKSQSVP